MHNYMTKQRIGLHPVKKITVFEKKNDSNLCIWCKKNSKKNIAHIISKNLFLSEQPNNKLRFSVCENCNSFWGDNIEDWILKYTPIGEWKENILKKREGEKKSNILSNYKYVPNLVYNEYYKQWIVVNHSKEGNVFPEQIILTKENQMKIFNTESSSLNNSETIFNEFILALKEKKFTTYISKLIADDFRPRIVKINNKIIIVAKDKSDEILFKEKLLNIHYIDVHEFIKDNIVGTIDAMHIHFKWSIKRYLSLTNKIAFEFLTLIKGSDYILDNSFDKLRTSLMNRNNKYDNLSILYDSDKGFAVKRLNFPSWITMADDFKYNKKIDIPVLSFLNNNKFNFSIIIYKYKNLICSTVKLFNIEISRLVLAKTNKPFDKIYGITYSFEEDILNIYESSENLEDFDEQIVIPYYSEKQLKLFI